MARNIPGWAYILLFTFTVTTAKAQTFNGQGGLPVPPGAPTQTVGITTSIAAVSGIGVLGNGCTIIDHLTLDFIHTWVGDVALFLIAPTGQVLELSSSNGGSGDNYQVTVFTDNTALFITQSAPPYNGTFRPEGRQQNTVPPFSNANPLGTFTFANTFNGLNADGNWTLLINDYVAADVGTLVAWSITFTSGGGPAPVVDLGPDLTICPGQSATLTALVVPSATSYLWSTGATSQSITVSPAINTTYYITVTNNGCIDKDTINIIVNSAGVNANAGPDQNICQGISATLNGTGGGPGATYNWSSGQSGPSIVVNPASTTTYTLTVTDGGCTGTDQVTVTITPIPNADAGPAVSICDGESTTLSATGGTLFNQYTWSSGQTGPVISVSPSITTTYTVTVTVNGCSDTDDIIVTVNASPIVDAGPNVQICSGESVQLTATGSGGQYLWSNGQSGPTISVSPGNTTTYTVTLTNNGCEASDNVQVQVISVNANIGPDLTICQGSSVTLTATGGSQYVWSTGQSGPSISVTPAITSTYTVTVSQGNCSDVADIEVEVIQIPVPVVSPDQEICDGETIVLNASGGITYLWSTGQNTSSISVSPGNTTTYVVTVTDTGCSSSASVEVVVRPTPNTSAGPDQSICDGEAAIITASGLSGPGIYEWSTGDVGTSITITPAITSTYTVTATNQWDCFASDAVTISVNPIPVANAGPDQDLCEGNAATLNASGGTTGSSYQWSTGQSGQSIDVNPINNVTYIVTVTVSGCSSSDEVDIIVLPAPFANAGLDETVCAGDLIQLTASGGGTYQWSNGQTTNSIDVSPLITTTYTVTVTSNNGCTDMDNVIVNANPLPQANAGPDQIICENEEAILQGTGGGTYQWSTGETSSLIHVIPAGTTTYSLTVTDINGCSDSDVATVVVNQIPIANAGTNVFIMSGESAILTASGGGTYLWNTGEVSPQITVSPLITTIYSVTVTINGCSAVDDVTVFVNEAPSVDLGPDLVICESETVNINAFVPGPFNLAYLWNTGETTSSINVSPVSTTSYIVTATDIVSGFFSIDTITVTVNSLPIGSPVIMGSTVLCQGTTITYTVNPVIGATTYLWSIPVDATLLSGQGTTSIDINWGSSIGGQVQLIVSNSCGALPASVADVIVNAPPVLIGQINGPTDPCSISTNTYSIPVIANADTYGWNVTGTALIISGQGTNSIQIDWNGSAGGQLCISSGNSCGISDTACLDVTTIANPLADAGIDQIICGLDGNLNAIGIGTWTMTGGPGTVQFSDSNSPTSSIQVTEPGSYVLQYSVSQNGCSDEDDVGIQFNDIPTIINVLSDCDNTNTSYNISFEISSGQAPFLINGASFAGGIFNSGPISSGDPYSFLVEDANGCTSEEITGQITCSCTSSAGEMDPGTINACIDAKITAVYLGGGFMDGNDQLAFILHDGNIPGGIISWNSIPEFSFVSPMQVGTTYFISAVIGDAGPGGIPSLTDPCVAISPGTPVVFHDFPLAKAGEDKILGCQPDVVELNAEGSSSGNEIRYLWNAIDGGIIIGVPDSIRIIAGAAGSYIISVKNITSGCISYDTASITSTELSLQNMEIESVSPKCTADCNGIIQIYNSGDGWLFDYGDGNFIPDTFYMSACSGALNVAIMDTFGCIVDTSILVESPLPVQVSLGPDQIISLGDSVLLEAISASDMVAFNWFSADTCSSCKEIVVSPVETTNYQVEITDQNGCTAKDEIVISVIYAHHVFVPNIFSPNGDDINDLLVIHGSKDLQTIQSFEIFDRWGNKLFEIENRLPGDPSLSWDGTCRGQSLNPGVYIYKIKALFSNDLILFDTGDFTLVK